jgi:hypothetical protein
MGEFIFGLPTEYSALVLADGGSVPQACKHQLQKNIKMQSTDGIRCCQHVDTEPLVQHNGSAAATHAHFFTCTCKLQFAT